MPGSVVQCIYCGTDVDPSRGEGDHVLPAPFGRFRDEFRFRRICRECNSKIGRCEEQLLRCAPEAYFRRLVNSPSTRTRGGRSWVGAHGSPPPKSTVVHGDHRELVDASTENPENVLAVDQLVIQDEDGKEHPVRLNPNMTADALKRRIASINVTPTALIHFHVDEANYAHYASLLEEVWPGRRIEEGTPRDAGWHRVPGQMECRFTDDYYRAIAKIGFHYTLVNSKRGFRGDESEFESIRDFIMGGGEPDTFFNGPGAEFVPPFGELPFGGAMLPSQWFHFMAADEAERHVSANVGLYFGPKRLPQIHRIHLAKLTSDIIVPDAQSAHWYVCEVSEDSPQYAGHVRAIQTFQISR